MSELISEIGAIVGADRLLLGADVAERMTSYWNNAPTQALAVVMPETTQEVSQVLRVCHAHEQAVITHGGLTNAVLATESTSTDVVLSLEKMNSVVEIDKVGGTAVVEAGTVLQKVQEAVAAEGLFFPLDLGARGSCTIGGNAATNAGGINVLRYGMMRNLVLGLEAVLADGTVISSMNRMMKNNAGYDLKQLFIGTEGTLGVITRLVLRLFPQPPGRQNALVAMQDFDGVIGLLGRMQQQTGGSLSAYEIMWGNYFKAVTGEGGHRAPMSRDYPYYVAIQVEDQDSESDAEHFESILGQALEDELIIDAVIPKSESEVRAIWDIREVFEALMKPEPVYIYDISLPIRDMDAYVTEVQQNITERWPNGECFSLGHVADGNLHFMVHPREQDASHEDSDRCVYDPLTAIGGSVSAEHGIGIEKVRWLSHSRSATEIDLMRTLKNSLDPKNILNPGRVIGSPTQS